MKSVAAGPLVAATLTFVEYTTDAKAVDASSHKAIQACLAGLTPVRAP
jgi:hypothetical protein